MDKKHLKIVIAVGLVVVLILVFANSSKRMKQKLRPGTAPSATIESPSVPPTQGTIGPGEMVKEHLEWGRCPFSGKVYSGAVGVGRAISFRLTGIIWDEKNPQALINDTIVSEGDILGSCTVIKIDKNKVILNDGSKDFELRLE